MSARRGAFRLLAEAVAGAALLAATVISPPVRQPARADVVVLLSGDAARLPVALRLIEEGVARTLVFVGQPDTASVAALCTESRSFEVVCLHPVPDNTRQEARAAARLAEERSWETMVVVTSRFHVTRAQLLFRRCFSGQVVGLGNYPRYGRRFAVRGVAHEWLGLVHASFLSRGC